MTYQETFLHFVLVLFSLSGVGGGTWMGGGGGGGCREGGMQSATSLSTYW